jgi:5-methylcytosine-specific restriction endonuclease McrA
LAVGERIRCLTGSGGGECRFYCSDKCKRECSIYRQVRNYRGREKDLSREVQPELRQLRFELDNYTCQKCGKHQSELKVGLHCHHLEGIRWEPLESADVDKCITVCKTCHKKIHKKDGCKYNEMRCE